MWTILTTLACIATPLYFFYSYQRQQETLLLLQQLDDNQAELYLDFRKLKDQRDEDLCALVLEIQQIRDSRYEDQCKLKVLRFHLQCNDGELKELWHLITPKNHAATRVDTETQDNE